MTRSTAFSPAFLARFRVVRKLGQGAMGEVYEAIQANLERHVAIKLLRPDHFDDKEGRDRFVDEARILARLSHPNIVTLLDADVEEGRPFLVMEFVDAPTLESIIERKRKLPALESVGVAIALLGGLQYLHDAGVVHRDLKPENILMLPDGTPKLVDFGLARALGTRRLTAQGFSVGTPMYMAPEQLTGRTASPQSDLYSMGMTLFHMLTGGYPIPAAKRIDLLSEKLALDEARLGAQMGSTPPQLVAIVARCLATLPDHRFDSAGTLAGELAILTTTVRLAADSSRATSRRSRRIGGWAKLWIGCALAAAVLAAGVVFLVRQPWSEPPLEPPARVESPPPPPAPPPAAPRPAGLEIARITTGASRARVWFATPPKEAMQLTFSRPGDSTFTGRNVTAGSRHVTLEGLLPTTRYRAEIRSAKGVLPFELETLGKESESDALVLEAAVSPSDDLDIAVRGDSLAAVWQLYQPKPRSVVVFRESPDRGMTWGARELPSGPEKVTGDPAIVLAGNGLMVAWTGESPDGFHGYVRVRSPAGLYSPVRKFPCRKPGLALAASEAAWVDLVFAVPDQAEAMFQWTRIDPDGTNVPAGVPAFSMQKVDWVRIARVGRRLAALLLVPGGKGREGILYCSTSDAPETGQWSAPVALTGKGEQPDGPSVTVGAGLLVVAYRTHHELRVLTSRDGGQTFARSGSPLPVELATKLPSVAVERETIFLACDVFGMAGVIGRKSLRVLDSPDGLAWTPRTKIPLWLFEPKCLKLAAFRESLAALQIDHMKGVLAFHLPR